MEVRVFSTAPSPLVDAPAHVRVCTVVIFLARIRSTVVEASHSCSVKSLAFDDPTTPEPIYASNPAEKSRCWRVACLPSSDRAAVTPPFDPVQANRLIKDDRAIGPGPGFRSLDSAQTRGEQARHLNSPRSGRATIIVRDTGDMRPIWIGPLRCVQSGTDIPCSPISRHGSRR